MRRPVNAAERLATRRIPSNARCILEHTNGSAAYVYEGDGPMADGGTVRRTLYAITFWGSSQKSHSHYRFRNEDERNQHIWKFRESVERSVKFRAEQKAKTAATPNPYKVGDIVNTSWGYDQTNVDFYIVTRRSEGCVWVRALVADSEATGWAQERVWPKMPIEMVGAEIRCRVIGGHVKVKGHGAHITTGDCHSSSYA